MAQINPTVGDLAGNAGKMAGFYQRARDAGADLVVFPELSLVGYPPLDLLGQRGFVARVEQELQRLAGRLGPTPALVGCVLPNPDETGRPIRNCAALLAEGRVQAVRAKTRLPTYDVFDEDRYFEPARKREVLEVAGVRLGVTICEDVWQGPEQPAESQAQRSRYQVDPVAELAANDLDVLINLSASPFCSGRGRQREQHLGAFARRLGRPVVLVNQVGGNDSLLFDGRSLALGVDGRLIARADAFREDLVVVDTELGQGDIRPSCPEGPAELLRAIVMGLSDYVGKCGFERVVFGLSGGIDSAVVAVLAAEAVGADRVLCLTMPSTYSSPHSAMDAERLAANLGVTCRPVPIQDILASFKAGLHPVLGDVTASLTEENLQARIRGTLVMACSNTRGMLALATGNKSELATGYCTLYGDMVGGLAPIGDLLKTQVYELARFINRGEEVIPQRIIDRPPSAELRPDQTDQDSLPAYDVLDPILDLVVTDGLDRQSIIDQGHPAPVVDAVIQLVQISEHKRRQSAPVLRVTRRAFGAGRQMPIARAFES